MSNIQISKLRADVLDRMDNLVQSNQLSESIRQKLKSEKRVTHALNQALTLFVRDADRATVHGFAKKVSLTADADIGTAGVVNKVTTYSWPTDSFEERPDGGLVKMILNDEERYYDKLNNTELESVRYMAQSSYYGDSHPVFHVDQEGKRIYVPENVTAEARIIAIPDQIQDDDTYGTGGEPPSEIPISETFLQTLSELGLQELIKMAQNYTNRERVMSDTMQTPTPVQQQQASQEQD